MAIGDGHISEAYDGRCKNAKPQYALRMVHCLRQREYAEHKAELVGVVLGKAIPKVREINNSGHPGVAFQKTHRLFRLLRKLIYRDGHKLISRGVPYLDDHGLAIWYMDDGSLTLHKQNGKIHARNIYLNTYTDREEADKLVELIQSKWGITMRPASHKGKWRLWCNTTETKKFVAIVDPYVVASMKYKTDLRYKGTEERLAPSN